MSLMVVTNTVVLVLLCLLTVGLLRSHAEILRRLNAIDADGEDDGAHGGHELDIVAAPSDGDGLPGPRSSAPPAADIAGDTPSGEALKLSVRAGRDTLIAFLSSGCLSCLELWEGMRNDHEPLPGGARLVVVTKGRDRESPSRLRELSPPGVPVVLSTEAWESYGITMSPYFVYVDGETGGVRSEGAAGAWSQVRSLLRDALEDERLAAHGAPAPPGAAGRLARSHR